MRTRRGPTDSRRRLRFVPCSSWVMGALLVHIAYVDVILVQPELIGRQDPPFLAPVAQGLGPPGRPYYLIGPPLRRDAGECPAHLQDVRVRGVALYGLAVHPSDVGRPAIVVGVGQTARPAVALGDARTVRDAWQEVVTLLERIDADAVLLG